ncbi:MAG TPA: hypothetical protein PLU44_17025 [Candidatus Krumholzibacteria bacterium]|nr:hypothetical protein [Candidatus Krumholzibacteria bacterium]HRY42052.1 hypothetical protein [Candidatus Krumholzibacteria bacterium]
MTSQVQAQAVASAIAVHIQCYGGQYSGWYVGISKDPNDRLLNGHNATSQRNAARYWDAATADAARAIEQHFLGQGCRGSWGGGNDSARYVYVYKIDLMTIE